MSTARETAPATFSNPSAKFVLGDVDPLAVGARPPAWSFGWHVSGSAAYAQQPFVLNLGGISQLRRCQRQAVGLGTINSRESYIDVPGLAGTSVCEWTGALAPGGFLLLR